MISRLKGQLLSRTADGLVEIETAGGVVYEAALPLSVLQRMPASGAMVELLTLQVVREDSVDLFGFLESSEREVFRLLMSVKGVGTRLALQALSVYSAHRLARVLAEKDVPVLAQVSGIGRKTAERMVLELWDKVAKLAVSGAPGTSEETVGPSQEAVAALVALGYSFADADDAVRRVLEDGGVQGAEELIKRVLERR